MSDTELTDTEAARLRQLLHRAADSLEVTTPDQLDHPELQPGRRPSGPGRWLAAAAVLVIAALGAAWWMSGDDADRIDTGPAEPTVTVAPQVLEQTGVWRLPEGLAGYRVVGAQDSGFATSSSVDNPGVMAVEETDDPRRWLLVEAYDELGDPPPDARIVDLSDEVTASLIPTEGSTWFRITPAGEGSSELVVSGSALGIDEVALTELLAEHFGTVEALSAAAGSTASMEAMLDDAGFGDDRLVWQGGDDPGPGADGRSIELTLLDDEGAEVVVDLTSSDAPTWAQIARLRMAAEIMSIAGAQFPAAASSSISTRPDLGRNVFESSYAAESVEPFRTLAIVTDDGVLIGVSATMSTATGATPAPVSAPALTEEQQLRIINSLRAMSEDEFRARLTEVGAEFVEPETAEMFVTTTPDGTVTPLPGGPED
jgi:hypothetical protein